MNDERDFIRVSLVQAQLQWHQPEANCRHFETLIQPLAGKSDLILLPEMFSSGFTQSPQSVRETMDGATVAWMREQAARCGAVVAGSLAMEVDNRFYNRFLWARPDGDLSWYDKRHLFGLGGETERYSAGRERVIVRHSGWRFCLQVCYDLRFPVWTRSRGDYDCLLFVANWPTPRAHAWRTLLRARAIENQCYVVGVNRVGKDGNGIDYSGDSAAVDFLGHDLADLGELEQVETVQLSMSAMEEFRERFPFHADADSFQLRD
ncbi:MAG: amidohydrolase [Xanthomonadales bacterium]|nr:amidohydrolase [Xanthomonadales bacterium]